MARIGEFHVRINNKKGSQMKTIANRVILVFGYILLGTGSLLVFVGTAFRIFQKAQESHIWYKKLFLAWGELTYLFSPFNIANYLTIIATLLPGLFFIWLAKKLQNGKK